MENMIKNLIKWKKLFKQVTKSVKDITDSNIENVWYMKAIKKMVELK